MEARHLMATVTRCFAAGRARMLRAAGTGAPSGRRRVRLIAATVAVALSILAFGASVAAAALPDGRAYELVSTSGNFGEPYAPPSHLHTGKTGVNQGEHPFQAAEDGEAVTYVGEPPESGGSGETGPGEGVQWLATRTAAGWTTAGITPQNNGEFQPFQAFSSNLETQIFEGGRQPVAAGVPAGCRSLYAREGAAGTYRALFVPTEGTVCGRPLLAGTADGGADVLFQSEAALVSPAVAATEIPPGREGHNEYGDQFGKGCTYGCNLYEATPGGLRLVNEIAGTPVPNAIFGGYPGRRRIGVANFSNAISADGSRIFWTDTQPGPLFEHVYVLENGTENVLVSGAGAAEYWTATPDGHYAYYTEAGGLWRFDTQTNTREPIAPEGSGAQAAIGTNQSGEDGAYVYFVASGALAPGVTARVCLSYGVQEEQRAEKLEEGLITPEEARAGREQVSSEEEEELNGQIPPRTGCNLYLRHGATTTLISVLAPEDNESEIGSEDEVADKGGDWKAGMGVRTAEVTPDGEHLVFQSRRALTGYTNHPEGSEQLQFEVFVYTAGGAAPVCVSCDPAGAPPNVTELEFGGSRLPASTSSTTYTRRWISADGSRVFFDSEQRLVTQDTNDVEDVYEWEREGTAGCPVATSTSGGCVFLISGGESQGYSFLVDSDATGENVFFEHLGPLGQAEVPAGRNALYDARVGGGFPEAPEASCVGGGCQGSSAGLASGGGSASREFEGAGNVPAKGAAQRRRDHLQKALRVCRKKPTKSKRAGCEKQARRRYGSGGSKKHSAVGKKTDDGRGA
jgi:hypothetical protein